MLKLDDFMGTWKINREIVDHKAKSVGVFKGKVHLAQHEDQQAIWHERGVLSISGAALQSERKFIWMQIDNDIQVSFEDGRYFHTLLSPQVGRVLKAEHQCPPDHYQVEYDLSHWPHWRSVWQSKGPRKDYTMVSLFERARG